MHTHNPKREAIMQPWEIARPQVSVEYNNFIEPSGIWYRLCLYAILVHLIYVCLIDLMCMMLDLPFVSLSECCFAECI